MATPSGYTQTSANGLTSNRSDADRKHQPVGFDTLLRGERPTGGHLPGEGTEWLDAIGF